MNRGEMSWPQSVFHLPAAESNPGKLKTKTKKKHEGKPASMLLLLRLRNELRGRISESPPSPH